MMRHVSSKNVESRQVRTAVKPYDTITHYSTDFESTKEHINFITVGCTVSFYRDVAKV